MNESLLEHRKVLAAIVAGILGAALAGALVAAFLGDDHDRRRGSLSASLEKGASGSPSAREAIQRGWTHLDIPEVSIGELIDRSPLIIRGTVVSVAEPRWNSEDGHDWRDEFEQNPEQYDTIPLPLTQVTLAVVDVVDRMETPGAPAVGIGDKLTLEFLLSPALDLLGPGSQEQLTSQERARYLAPGDERIFFIEWREFPVPVGVGPKVWRGDADFGIWGIDRSGVVFPVAFEHNFSLQTALAKRDVQAVELAKGRVGLSLGELKRIIALERRTPDRAEAASYEVWPWEPAYEASFAEDEVAPGS